MKYPVTVIDTSVAIKWFVREAEGKHEAAQVLSQVEASPRLFAVPELFFNEMLSVLCRLCTSESQVVRYLKVLEELGFHRIGNGSELLAVAAGLALHYRLTGYDAVYAASAQLVSGTWLTADQKAHKKIEKLGISRSLVS